MLPMSLGDHWKVDKSGNFRVFFLPSWRGNDPIFFHNLRKVDEQTPSPLGALQRPFKGPSTQIYLTSQSKGFLENAQFVSHKCLIPDQFEGRLKSQLQVKMVAQGLML
jgi:hypothetical protein